MASSALSALSPGSIESVEALEVWEVHRPLHPGLQFYLIGGVNVPVRPGEGTGVFNGDTRWGLIYCTPHRSHNATFL